jgi:hypothetical protein
VGEAVGDAPAGGTATASNGSSTATMSPTSTLLARHMA